MNLKVRVSTRAERDVDAIYDWLADRSPEGALRWYQTYLSALDGLSVTALGSASAPEADLLGIDLRQAFFGTRKGHVYRFLMVLKDGAIHVVGIRGAGQANATWGDLELPE